MHTAGQSVARHATASQLASPALPPLSLARRADARALPQAVRCCPLCRQLSWFVTPSAIWPRTPEAKAATIAAYKARLATIDCRMFASGAGTCPHGTSCFYRHAYPDGRLEARGRPRRPGP